MPLFHATILTLFPEMFPGPLGHSLSGKALGAGIWSYNAINIRDFGLTKHKKVDDTSYGGTGGLVMRPDVLGSAIDYAIDLYPESQIYYPSPRGTMMNQSFIRNISKQKQILILCGRFEGIDERVIEQYNITEFSLGDYVLSGGEVAAFGLLDCVIRLLDGVLDNKSVLSTESFEKIGGYEHSLLEYPLYTKPVTWKGHTVPDILCSGHHQKIEKWQLEQSIALTKKRRPDLLNK
ncbi:MAG: tRNA (guanosine(37)-N1)-methyltransferase TrmD [Rickettsiaceae bacterium]